MPRTSTASSTSFLMAAAILAVVPLAAQAQAPSQAPSLPAGAGKETVETVCTGCHQTNMITQSSGYTRAGWN
jgi:virginiamycin B lyase